MVVLVKYVYSFFSIIYCNILQKLFAFTIPLLRTSALGGCCTLTILMTERSLQLALEKRNSQD